MVLLFSMIAASSTVNAQSRNQGWSKPVDVTSGVGRNVRAPGIAVCDPYQNIHVFYADRSDDGAAIYYRNDINGTLSFPIDVLRVDDARIYNLRVVVSPHDNMVYLTWTNVVTNGLMYFSSAPLSRAGHPSAYSTPRIMVNRVYNSDISVDPEGNLHMVYSASDDAEINIEVQHITSSDGGITWSDPELVFSRSFTQPAYIMVWMDTDQRGRLHLALTLRSHDYGIFSEVGYINTLEDGLTWTGYQMIQEKGTTFQGVAYIDVYAFGEDEIHLTWHDPRRMHQWSRDGGKTWSKPDEIMVLGAAFGGPNELSMDSSGTLHVVTAINYGVFHAEWKDQRWSEPDQIDNDNHDPHGQNLVVCQGNQLHVLFRDLLGEDTIWYATRNVNTPAIERRPIPQQNPNVHPELPAATSLSTDITSNPSTNDPPISLSITPEAMDPPASTQSALSGLVLGVFPAMVFVLGVIILMMVKNRR